MPRFTVSVPDDLNEWLEAQYGDSPDEEFDSKAGVARHHLHVARRVDELEEDVDEVLEAIERVRELEAELDEVRDRLDSREERIGQLEEQLARRSQIEDRIDELAIEVRESEESANAPFFVRWYRWFRSDKEE